MSGQKKLRLFVWIAASAILSSCATARKIPAETLCRVIAPGSVLPGGGIRCEDPKGVVAVFGLTDPRTGDLVCSPLADWKATNESCQ